MGFGIRVPGVRISTRGVRVGPRFASVGVSTRGRVSGSVGPRIARVSASPRGVRVGTGLGPLGVSVGRGGVRASGGIGPVFGSVGRSGVVAGAGLGPIWAATGFGGGRNSSLHKNAGNRHSRMGMAVQYQRYRDEIAKSGGSRRTPDEMRIAGINALIADFQYMAAPLQKFIVPEPQRFESEELSRWAIERAIQGLLNSGQLTERPKDIPPEATRESVLEGVLQTLNQEGVSPPNHPAVRFGIRQERLPTHDELMNYSLSECRNSTSVFSQVLRRKAFLRSVRDLCNEIETELPHLLTTWEQETQAYEFRIEEMCRQHIEKRNAKRKILIEANADVQTLIDSESQVIRDQQDSVLEIIRSVHSLFISGDPTITTLVLQALMSDNEGSAAPIGIDQGDLLVVMTAPAATDVIWPEKTTQNDRISATKKNKADVNTDFYMFLLSHSVATAREAIVASSHIQQVRVLILDEQDGGEDFFSRRLVAVLDASRSDLERISHDVESAPWVQKGTKAVNRWQRALQSADSQKILYAADEFVSVSILHVKDFMLEMVALLGPFTDSFTSFIDIPVNKRPKLIEFTESHVNTADEIQITVSKDADSMKTLDVEISLVSLPDFWVLCGLLADQWDQEQVDIEALKQGASELCTFLYPPAT